MFEKIVRKTNFELTALKAKLEEKLQQNMSEFIKASRYGSCLYMEEVKKQLCFFIYNYTKSFSKLTLAIIDASLIVRYGKLHSQVISLFTHQVQDVITYVLNQYIKLKEDSCPSYISYKNDVALSLEEELAKSLRVIDDALILRKNKPLNKMISSILIFTKSPIKSVIYLTLFGLCSYFGLIFKDVFYNLISEIISHVKNTIMLTLNIVIQSINNIKH